MNGSEINLSSILTEPMAILELCALVLTIVYIGRLALEDLWSTNSKTSSNRLTSLSPLPSSSYNSSVSKRWNPLTKQTRTKQTGTKQNKSQTDYFKLWGSMSELIQVGSLISLPKKSLSKQSLLVSMYALTGYKKLFNTRNLPKRPLLNNRSAMI